MSQEEAEELLQSTKEQTRTNTEPSAADDSPELKDALRDAFEVVLSGEVSSNSTVRDENIAALLRGLDEAGELGDVIANANAKLDREDDGENRNEALKALVRLGLAEVRPELMEVATDARNDVERKDRF